MYQLFIANSFLEHLKSQT